MIALMDTTMKMRLFALATCVPLFAACGDENDSEPEDTGTDAPDVAPDVADTSNDVIPDIFRDLGPDFGGDVPIDGADDGGEADATPDVPPPPECTDPERILVADDASLLPECTASCIEDEDPAACTATCLIDAGFGEDCSACGLAGAECLIAACPDECATGADECAACEDTSCAEAFVYCVGEPPPEPDSPVSTFHVIHLLPDAGPVDVRTSRIRAPFVEGLEFGQTSGAVDAVGGDATIDFSLAGVREPLVSTRAEFAFGPDEFFSAAVFGTTEEPAGVTIREDGSSPPDGDARYRYVHAASGIEGTINLWLANEGEPDDTFLEDIEYGTTSDDATRDGGAHRIAIDFDRDGTKDVFVDQGELEVGGQYTFWIASDETGTFILRTNTTGEAVRFDAVPVED